jgi:hypothetical protein
MYMPNPKKTKKNTGGASVSGGAGAKTAIFWDKVAITFNFVNPKT